MSSKRINLPYTTQDLFPQSMTTQSNSKTPNSTRAGSIISTPSSFYLPRPNLHHYNSKTSYKQKFKKASNFISRIEFKNLKTMIKRLFKPKTLDFETAIWEIFHLIINPRKMYRSHYYYRQQQKHQVTQNGGLNTTQSQISNNSQISSVIQTNETSSYTRDDPSFLILITLFLSISAIAWGLAYSPNIIDILKLILYMVIIDFYIMGIIISTITWIVTNKIFNLDSQISKYSINYIEWGFCFDIHCNSFLIIWCLLYLVQFILLPIIRIKNSILGLIIGNTLYFGSIGYYFIVSFYGFNSLPFITSTILKSNYKNPARILQLIVVGGILPILLIIWLITILFRINVAEKMIHSYFN
ncbi:uncharacterized protein KGF55_004036 [Candida pseudojiufengensis]|uniref:uncharacterized protein n=1 Tax=Candida pseudojiufengensis TaxID=497109 RepID=UPI0022254B5C|nr:uncharacterized protein KGF55_004036 [Candida pseudojiufengensis]KAI5961413.1 hypothetical protein KGF55_004036 [Candida pseudojiufengensis]